MDRTVLVRCDLCESVRARKDTRLEIEVRYSLYSLSLRESWGLIQARICLK